jgi:succinate dehydrogenase / fumarate reductase, iron-sulfur subunit
MMKYEAENISPDMSFLEMLDVVNWRLIAKGEDPIAFDHDCREGICGSCGMMINGVAHGPRRATATCQLHMRHFRDGDTIYIEPWRSNAFPVIKDLIVDRSALDRIIQAGGYISVSAGSAPEANAILVSKADRRFGDGCSRLHWMRRLCGRVSQRFSSTLYQYESLSSCTTPSRSA